MPRSAADLKPVAASIRGRADDRLHLGTSIALMLGVSAVLWYGIYVLIAAILD